MTQTLTPSQHKIAYADKFLIATGIAAFYYFDPSDPLRLPSPSEFIIDNRLLLSALALFLLYESYKLYKDLNTPSRKKITPGKNEDKSYLTPERSIALQATFTALIGITLFAYDHNMVMDNIWLVAGAFALIAGKLSYDLYVYYKKDKKSKDIIDQVRETNRQPKAESTSKLITEDMLLTGAVLTICLANHLRDMEILAENWVVDVAAGFVLAGALAAYVIYHVFGCGQSGGEYEPEGSRHSDILSAHTLEPSEHETHKKGQQPELSSYIESSEVITPPSSTSSTSSQGPEGVPEVDQEQGRRYESEDGYRSDRSYSS